MTTEERAWQVIKDMHISGPWQEHLVHEAIMSFHRQQWHDIKDSHPEDGQRVLTWNNKFCENRIQVYNEECQCWDMEDGDDIEFKLDAKTKDGRLIIQYWQSLPEKPSYIEYIEKMKPTS